jgi:hypothetical protein
MVGNEDYNLTLIWYFLLQSTGKNFGIVHHSVGFILGYCYGVSDGSPSHYTHFPSGDIYCNPKVAPNLSDFW